MGSAIDNDRWLQRLDQPAKNGSAGKRRNSWGKLRFDSSNLQEKPGGDVSVACETNTKPRQGKAASKRCAFDKLRSTNGKNETGEPLTRAAGMTPFWST